MTISLIPAIQVIIESVWLYNKNLNKIDSYSDCSRKYDKEELDCKLEKSRTGKEVVLEIWEI